jgi:aminoglycoside phosphotransferase (APT) family kinase protein
MSGGDGLFEVDPAAVVKPETGPEPLGHGASGDGFPWPWSVYRWLKGRNPVAGAVEEPELPAEDLGTFVAALRRVDARGGPQGTGGCRCGRGTSRRARRSPSWRAASTPTR